METTYLINSIWILCASVFVFMMQMGFACCESGFARGKNACNIWLKNFCDFCVGALVYYFIGFGFMYGDDWHGIIGINGFFDPLNQDIAVWQGMEGSLSPQVYLLFQTMFCATTATIISGAVAERFKFNTYLILSAFMTGIVYPVIGHWVWGGGWLSQIGFSDFAGSGAVHMCGGIAALVATVGVGPRIGKYVNGKSVAIPGHNISMAMLGGFILWVGWYGFNPGSELAFDDVTLYTTVTTTFAASAGGLTALFFTWIKYGKPDPTLAMNGALAGLVAVCTGVAEVTYIGSMIIGVIAAIMFTISVSVLDNKFHVDDVAGAISLHGMSGSLGVILPGFLSTENGLLYGGGAGRLVSQFIGMISIWVFTVICVSIIIFILKKTIGIRVPEEIELAGLDITEHGMIAYPEKY